ncbi:MAG: amidohydrolase [Candidatus Symbiothrix sp.]|jgi:predicted amidohydrolase|nr:amidohydrolase [Candidatus Symbiothrix sp.]
MDNLRISLVQSEIAWENKEQNLMHYGRLLEGIAEKSDLAVLPEMFSTGFSMQAGYLAETNEDFTIQNIRSRSKEYDLAVCGSFLAKDDDSGNIFNRGFFVTPQGEAYFYDKRHLFRMGEENKRFTAGEQKLIIPYQGWNIRLIICYDLRFPVWTRNPNNEYDILICPANWPEPRAHVWEILLRARAIENQCYVCGTNRIGEDGIKIPHRGNSTFIDFKGKTLAEAPDYTESIITASFDKGALDDFRKKFPAWQDADSFEIK